MSDLPLNWQLTDRDARFVRKARTAAQYRFYALAGGPPARPGLVRSNSTDACSIALEIWSMPKTELGSFLEAIPYPLGIGSIELSDGSWIKGFVCDASGVQGAEDISHIGDWRMFLEQELETARCS
jgi:allophanate hydrolase